MEAGELTARNEALAELIHAKLGTGGSGLEARVRRAGRLLPRRIRQEAGILIEAAALAENPKLARRVDLTRAEAAHAACAQFLEHVDPVARRWDFVLGVLGSIAFGLIVIFAVVTGVMVWRGYL